MSESASEHQRRAAEYAKNAPIRCAVLTISDTRELDNDESGALIERLLTDAGHEAVSRQLVPDDPQAICDRLEQWIADPQIQVVLTTGGTGIAARDNTIAVVRRLLTTELEGFGELFRMLSFREIQGAAMLSQAVGGLVARDAGTGGDTFIFAMPGSANAVRLAMTRLIAPQLAHLVWQRG